jgi:enoyl reductase
MEAGLLLLAWPSAAKTGWDHTKHPGEQDPAATSPSIIQSHVTYTRSYDGSGAKMAPPRGAHWKPPACWYEPQYTPEQFESYLNSHYVAAQDAYADMARRYGGDDFHKGDDGTWWELEVPDTSRAGECAELESWAWFTPGEPPAAEVSAADPRTLAGLAYARTVLPGPEVALRPSPQNQFVNLATEVVLAAPLERVTVTARLDNDALGIHVAATTVAEPYELRVEAGAPDAEPASCTYKVSGGRLDTRGAGCNVTYRRVSPPGGRTLTATLVWAVRWTPSADPDGPAATPPLPDGESATRTSVTVREAQSVTR